MASVRQLFCDYCRGETDFEGEDGFLYCGQCGSQSQDVIGTAADDEDMFAAAEEGRNTLYSFSIQRKPVKVDPDPSDHPGRSLEQSLREGDEPRNFASDHRAPGPVKIATEMRYRYVQGLQVMLQKQCESLIEQFHVSPIICSIAPSIWLSYVAASRIFEENWISNQIDLYQENEKYTERRSTISMLHTLRKTIPIYSTISISFLSCHIARETILPTDITDWALTAKLPYLSIFLEMDKHIGPPSAICPLNSRAFFRPVVLLSSWQLETISSKIAEKIGLQLPPVNFYAFSKRFLLELSLSSCEKILPIASRVFEWLLPAETWITSNQFGIPTRVVVMAILVITLRILYGINGYGVWEKSLRDINENEVLENNNNEDENDDIIMEDNVESEFRAINLLRALEASYDKIEVEHDHTKDLDSYLKYCKDIVFPGMHTSNEDEAFIDRFFKFYNDNEDNLKLEEPNINGKRSSDLIDANLSSDSKNKQIKLDKQNSCDLSRIEALEKMKLEMEENGFHYLPPITNRKSEGYLNYKRRMLHRELVYVVDADYYILLRAFARLARVDVRIMHSSVLELERKLVWIEEQIRTCFVSSKDPTVETREFEVDSD